MTGHTTADGSSLILMRSKRNRLTGPGSTVGLCYRTHAAEGFLTCGAGALTSLHDTRSGSPRRSAPPPWQWKPPATVHAPSPPSWWLGSAGPSSNPRCTFPAALSSALRGIKTSEQTLNYNHHFNSKINLISVDSVKVELFYCMAIICWHPGKPVSFSACY